MAVSKTESPSPDELLTGAYAFFFCAMAASLAKSKAMKIIFLMCDKIGKGIYGILIRVCDCLAKI